jgi:hypothetical protein
MADEPKPEPQSGTNSQPDATPPAGSDVPSDGASISPAPTDVTDTTSGQTADTANAAPAGGGAAPPADALSDGTKPTILKTGASHHSMPKGKATLTRIYRKADIMTTLFTFVGAIIAGAIILGVYAYLTRSKSTTPPPTKVTTLDKSELEKLDAFFNGNSAGKSSEILTISSSSLFKNRVAVSSDLKVVGALQVSATTALADLTVDKTSTLGVTNVRGSLTVSGPATFQNPAILGAGATVNGNLAVSGNGSFGGSVSAGTLTVRDLTVSGTLNLSGHISIAGVNPSAAPASSFVSSASVSGNDAGGSVTISMPPVGAQALGANLVTVTFHTAYPRVPNIVITPVGRGSALFQPYILKTATNFTIGAATIPGNSNATSYTFDYWIAQ